MVRGRHWCSIPTQAVDAAEPWALLVLRLIVTQVVDGDWMHAPEKCFPGDGSGFGGGEVFLLIQWLHCAWSFPCPRSVEIWIAGPEEAKNPAGENPPPDSDFTNLRHNARGPAHQLRNAAHFLMRSDAAGHQIADSAVISGWQVAPSVDYLLTP